jgi:formylglycine-generating enzyme required for sulfatase activity
MRLSLFLTSLLAPAMLLFAQQQPDQRRIVPALYNSARRHALLIGNRDYPRQPLLNPVNDATDLGASLTAAGFHVTVMTNLKREAMDEALTNFTATLSPGDAALVYFSGHGLEVQGQNYLLPIDFVAAAEYQVRNRALNANEVLEALKSRGVAVSILILDACRNNPYRAWARASGGGLAALQADGAYIAFAAAPGQVASDNPNQRNGLFTKHLRQALEQPGLSINDVFDQVRERVYRESANGQRPFSTTGLIGRFAFRDAPAAQTLPPPPPPKPEVSEADRLRTELEAARRELAARNTAPPRTEPPAPTAPVRESAPAPAAAAPPPLDMNKRVNPKDGLTYIFIPPGAFSMGCSPNDKECASDEKPPRRITLTKGYWMGETEVTQEAYRRVTNKRPSKFKSVPKAVLRTLTFRRGGDQGAAELPVESVTWNEASDYCSQIGGRLPTEAEWEYAARAGTNAAHYEDVDVDQLAWHIGNSGDSTHPIKTRKPNRYGLYDMLGNVWEWTADYYGALPSAGSDPKGPPRGERRLARGGSWSVIGRSSRVSNRTSFESTYSDGDIGFRCVCEQ